MTSAIIKSVKSEIPLDCEGMRVDKALAVLFPDYSRSTMQKWIKQGLIVVDEEVPSQRDRVQGGERVELAVPEARAVEWQAAQIDLTIAYEDEHILVVNKPAGLVVHPGAGNPDGTLVNGLLHTTTACRPCPGPVSCTVWTRTPVGSWWWHIRNRPALTSSASWRKEHWDGRTWPPSRGPRWPAAALMNLLAGIDTTAAG